MAEKSFMQLIIYPGLFIIAYLFGSFPTAYLLLKWSKKIDIRSQGSGNVGAMNAMRVSKSKLSGAFVLVVDLLKGALPAWYFSKLMPDEFLIVVILVSGVLLGHVYPVWLKFKGGRGLAVTAGALLVIRPELVGIWIGIWLIFYLLVRRHIIASLIATFCLPIIVFFTRGVLFSDDILLLVLPVCMLIFQRHLERIPDLVEEKRLAIKNGDLK
jgi:glycerol-3-phosphate acyltransferase PlsY